MIAVNYADVSLSIKRKNKYLEVEFGTFRNFCYLFL